MVSCLHLCFSIYDDVGDYIPNLKRGGDARTEKSKESYFERPAAEVCSGYDSIKITLSKLCSFCILVFLWGDKVIHGNGLQHSEHPFVILLTYKNLQLHTERIETVTLSLMWPFAFTPMNLFYPHLVKQAWVISSFTPKKAYLAHCHTCRLHNT